MGRKKKSEEHKRRVAAEGRARYRATQCKGFGAVLNIRSAEAAYLASIRAAKGMTWLQVFYRGLGLSRPEVLGELRKKGLL